MSCIIFLRSQKCLTFIRRIKRSGCYGRRSNILEILFQTLDKQMINLMMLYKWLWMIKATLSRELKQMLMRGRFWIKMNIVKTTFTEVYIVSVALEKTNIKIIIIIIIIILTRFNIAPAQESPQAFVGWLEDIICYT